MHEVAAKQHHAMSKGGGEFKPTSMSSAKPPVDDKKLDDQTEKPDEIEDDMLSLEDGDMDVNPKGSDTNHRAAAAMHGMEQVAQKLGLHVHSGAHEDPVSFIEHMTTALMTLVDKEETDEAEAEEEEDEEQKQDNHEGEVAESPPIMMSTTFTEREKKAIQANYKKSHADVITRIGVLHGAGYIDDKIKGELLQRHGEPAKEISLSMVNEDLTVAPGPVVQWVEAYERQMASGKAGPFAKVKPTVTTPTKKGFDPAKPISSSVHLSVAEEEAVDPPDSEQSTRASQEAAGDELARMAGAPNKKPA